MLAVAGPGGEVSVYADVTLGSLVNDSDSASLAGDGTRNHLISSKDMYRIAYLAQELTSMDGPGAAPNAVVAQHSPRPMPAFVPMRVFDDKNPDAGPLWSDFDVMQIRDLQSQYSIEFYRRNLRALDIHAQLDKLTPSGLAEFIDDFKETIDDLFGGSTFPSDPQAQRQRLDAAVAKMCKSRSYTQEIVNQVNDYVRMVATMRKMLRAIEEARDKPGIFGLEAVEGTIQRVLQKADHRVAVALSATCKTFADEKHPVRLATPHFRIRPLPGEHEELLHAKDKKMVFYIDFGRVLDGFPAPTHREDWDAHYKDVVNRRQTNVGRNREQDLANREKKFFHDLGPEADRSANFYTSNPISLLHTDYIRVYLSDISLVYADTLEPVDEVHGESIKGSEALSGGDHVTYHVREGFIPMPMKIEFFILQLSNQHSGRLFRVKVKVRVLSNYRRADKVVYSKAILMVSRIKSTTLQRFAPEAERVQKRKREQERWGV